MHYSGENLKVSMYMKHWGEMDNQEKPKIVLQGLIQPIISSRVCLTISYFYQFSAEVRSLSSWGRRCFNANHSKCNYTYCDKGVRKMALQKNNVEVEL